jgi:DNA-directed RNA polymerase specialized sigma24 family protein
MNIPFLTEEWLMSIRQKLIRFFAVEQCADPEGLTDETIFRMVKAISNGKTIAVKPGTYAYAVAKRVAKEKKREARKRNEVALDETTPQPPLPDHSYQDATHACLEKCLAALTPVDRALIIEYHEGTASGDDMRNRIALARRLKMPVKTLRKIAMRIRQRLEGCISACLEGE